MCGVMCGVGYVRSGRDVWCGVCEVWCGMVCEVWM